MDNKVYVWSEVQGRVVEQVLDSTLKEIFLVFSDFQMSEYSYLQMSEYSYFQMSEYSYLQMSEYSYLQMSESDGSSPCPCSRPASVMADNGRFKLYFFILKKA